MCAVLTLAVVGMFAYQGWSPWQGPRRWFLLRYPSPAPPDPAALQHSLAIFTGLVVHPAQMRQNLELTHGQIVAEAVMMHLGQFVGRQQAHDLVYDACAHALASQASLYEVLDAMPEVTAHLVYDTLKSLLDPANYVGLAPLFVDNVTKQIDNG